MITFIIVKLNLLNTTVATKQGGIQILSLDYVWNLTIGRTCLDKKVFLFITTVLE